MLPRMTAHKSTPGRSFSSRRVCPVRVCAESSIEDGEEMKDYVCIITVTPARLWELSGQVDGLYYVERLWDSVKERFDETVWTSEGA